MSKANEPATDNDYLTMVAGKCEQAVRDICEEHDLELEATVMINCIANETGTTGMVLAGVPCHKDTNKPRHDLLKVILDGMKAVATSLAEKAGCPTDFGSSEDASELIASRETIGPSSDSKSKKEGLKDLLRRLADEMED